MSILDSFVSYNFNAGVPYVSITNNGMTFNKAVVIKLGYPKYVVLLVDAEGKRVAVQACTIQLRMLWRFTRRKSRMSFLSDGMDAIF